MNLGKQQRLLIIGGAVILFILMAIFVSASNQGKEYITVSTVPSNAAIRVGSHGAKSDVAIKVAPGKYKVAVSANGFAAKVQDVTVKKGTPQTVQIGLQASNDVGRKWLRDHPEDQIKADGFGSQAFDKEVQANQQNNPIITDLPVYENTFQITYGSSVKNPGKQGAIGIYITTSSDQGKQDAMDWFAAFGYKPSDYEIIYRTPDSP